jgi:hypothetical protein
MRENLLVKTCMDEKHSKMNSIQFCCIWLKRVVMVYSVCLRTRNILGLRYRSTGEFGFPSTDDHTHRDLDSTEIVKLIPPASSSIRICK